MVNIMKNYKIIYLISFFSGFLSLSQEILWMRIISFAGMSVPQTFSFTLALFLVGISIGAIIGKKICKLRENLQLSNIGIIFFIAALVDLLLIVLVYFSFYFNGLILVLGSFAPIPKFGDIFFIFLGVRVYPEHANKLFQ